MSAEYTLHIKTSDITEEDMEGFFYNHLGSKYDPMEKCWNTMPADLKEKFNKCEDIKEYPELVEFFQPFWAEETRLHEKWGNGKRCDLYEKFSATPQFDVGEVSFLKAALFEGGAEEYIPSLVGVCCDVIDDGCTITDEVIEKIRSGMLDNPNTTQYTICETDEVVKWLKEHIGEYVFSIAW
jgi:hypothetical protein